VLAARLIETIDLGKIDDAEIARQSRLSEADVLALIAKQAKQREESIAAFKQATARTW
jgi:uncharacterized protein YqeY